MTKEGIFEMGVVMPTIPVSVSTTKVVTTTTEMEVIDRIVIDESSTEKLTTKKSEVTTSAEKSTTIASTTALVTEKSSTEKLTTKKLEVTTSAKTTAASTTVLVTEKSKVTPDPTGSGGNGDFGDDDASTDNAELSPMVPEELNLDETIIDAEDVDEGLFTSTVDLVITDVSKTEKPRILRQPPQPEASCELSHSDVEKSGWWTKQFPNLSFRITNKKGRQDESVLHESKPSREQNRSFPLPSYELSENDFSELSDVTIEWFNGELENDVWFGTSILNTADIFGFANEAPGSDEAFPITSGDENNEIQVGNTHLTCKFLVSDE
jgi:hypothetical protein